MVMRLVVFQVIQAANEDLDKYQDASGVGLPLHRTRNKYPELALQGLYSTG